MMPADGTSLPIAVVVGNPRSGSRTSAVAVATARAIQRHAVTLSGDVGRVWSLSRPLTYRALDQLTARGYIHPIGEEPGIAGGNRTILAATRSGRAQLRKWLNTPVAHLRDLRSELLLKLVIAEICNIDLTAMLEQQRDHIEHIAATLTAPTPNDSNGSSDTDVVNLWRTELSQAALRFLDRLPHP